jgi:hypothetical protein
MSERERWIVYPLLFFALGAALRDKLLQRVESKEIFCEKLSIVDAEDPTRLLAQLGTGREIPFNPDQTPGRIGVLTLHDSDGKEVCQLTRDLHTSRVVTNLLLVVDPVNQLPHVVAGTEQVPGMSIGGMDSPVSFQGVLELDNLRIQFRPLSRQKPKAEVPAEQ